MCNAALVGEGEDVVAEIPCICDAVKQPGESGGASLKASLPDSSSLSSVEKKKFSGWPTIRSFSVHGAKKKVLEFMGQWYFVQDWKYTVHYLGSYSDSISDYHLYQVYPIHLHFKTISQSKNTCHLEQIQPPAYIL